MIGKKLCAKLLDGNLTDRGTYISGTCRGFYVTVDTAENGMFSFRISAHSAYDAGNATLRGFVESQKNSVKQIQSVNVSNNSVNVVVTRPFLAKKIPAHMNEAIMPIMDFLSSGGYTSGCMECGTQNAQIDCYEINGTHNYLCASCVNTVEAALLDRKQEILSKKSNLISGVVGAVLGSLIGCVVFFLLWQMNYIAAIAGLVTAVCAFKGYEMLGGVVDKKGVVACVIVILAAVFFATQIAWTYDAYKFYKDFGYSFFDCFRQLKAIISLNNRTGDYYANLVMSYLLTILGSYRSVANAFKSSTGSYKVKKLDE